MTAVSRNRGVFARDLGPKRARKSHREEFLFDMIGLACEAPFIAGGWLIGGPGLGGIMLTVIAVYFVFMHFLCKHSV
jgi:hypothetical protein